MASVLVIDDEMTLRAAIEAMLMDLGHTVVPAENGREGVELFERYWFDLVVTDIVMPIQDGIETILQLRARRPNIKIIAASSGAPRGSLSRLTPPGLSILDAALEMGASAVLAKPFTSRQLRVVVDHLLRGSDEATSTAGELARLV